MLLCIIKKFKNGKGWDSRMGEESPKDVLVWRTYLPTMVLCAILLLFLAVASPGLWAVQAGDENVYFYMGKLVSGGSLPYKDFFFAHPPLQLLVIAPFFMMFGYNAVLLKLVSLLCMAASGMLVYLITRKAHGAWSGVLAAALFLLGYSVLFNATIGWGVEIALLFLLLGYHTIGRRPLLAGVLLGLAAMTRLIALVAIALLFIWVAIQDRRKAGRIAMGFGIGFVIPTLILIVAFGRSFLDPVYLFHFLKTAHEGGNLAEYWSMITLNWPLFGAALLLLPLLAMGKARLTFPAIAAAGYLVSLLFVKTLFGYYFLPALAFMAMAGGAAIVGIMETMRQKRVAAWSVGAILVLGYGWNLAADASFLFQEGFSGFSRVGDVEAYIGGHFGDGMPLVGDDSITPLMALRTGRSIAFNAVDTNDQAFSSGAQSLGGLLERIKGQKGGIIFLARTTQGIAGFPETRGLLNNHCAFEAQLTDKELGGILIYRC